MIDYTDTYREMHPSVANGLLAVQAQGRMLVKFWREENPLLIDGFDKLGRRRQIRCPYTIESAWLSREARPDTDDFACVQCGPDVEHLTATEARKFVRAAEAGRSFFDIALFL